MSIVPQLSVRPECAAIEFYKAAVGAVKVYRVGGTDDNPDVVAQLSVGRRVVLGSDESWKANFSPESIGLLPARGSVGAASSFLAAVELRPGRALRPRQA
jgi:uncharacterized glyoxalase superfamily protein PhnB